MELSKVLEGFTVSDTLVIKAQVQVIRCGALWPTASCSCAQRVCGPAGMARHARLPPHRGAQAVGQAPGWLQAASCSTGDWPHGVKHVRHEQLRSLGEHPAETLTTRICHWREGLITLKQAFQKDQASWRARSSGSQRCVQGHGRGDASCASQPRRLRQWACRDRLAGPGSAGKRLGSLQSGHVRQAKSGS